MNEELHKKINEHYQLGQGSIQDIARVYNLSVEQVLEAIGQTEMLEVESVGDLVDARELEPGTPIVASKKHRAKYTTN